MVPPTTIKPKATGLSEAVAHLARVEPRLADIIEQVGECRLKIEELQTPFEALAESIIYQQITGKAAQTITNRLIEKFAPKAFPEPSDIVAASDEDLRSVGISRPKVLALRDLAEKTISGLVPTMEELHTMGDQEIIDHLIQIRGIGRWTAEMLLIFRLGRMDVLPIHDYGVRKGFAIAFNKKELPTPLQLQKRGEKWKPYRTVASWYLWRATDSLNGRAK
jgi:3-methyladenine DNA glycosylase/8-oxoguanine DNA glycosylase